MKLGIFLTLITLIVSACATGKGPIAPFPKVSNPSNSSNIRIVRDEAIMGSAQTITFTLNGRELYMFTPGDNIEFEIDSGEHLFGVKCHGGWQMAGNVSEMPQVVQPGKTYLFRIIPDMNRGCRIERSSQ